jgi:U3 small nucleolar RNA-associated protein 18
LTPATLAIQKFIYQFYIAANSSKMAPQQPRKRSRKPKEEKRPGPEQAYDLEVVSSEDEDIELERDAAEEELEKLVFGDSIGFREGIKSFTLEANRLDGGSDGEEVSEEGSALEDVADADV